jgi:hypothetical protein
LAVQFEGGCLPKTAVLRTLNISADPDAPQPALPSTRPDGRRRASTRRDFAAITAANLVSFAPGELLNLYASLGVLG